MKRISILLLPLLVLLVSGFGETPSNVHHIVPRGIVGVSFVCPEEVEAVEISYLDAKKLMTEDVFFNGFDRNYLIFHATRYETNPARNKLPFGTYVTEKIYIVKRSRDAEAVLGVSGIIYFYEVGEMGIKGGMSAEEVGAVLGQPRSVEQLGPYGSFEFVYDEATVRFLEGKVAHLSRTR